MNKDFLGRLLRVGWTIPACIAAVVLIWTGHFWLGYGLDVLILANAFRLGIGARKWKKLADGKGVEFVNMACSKILELHQPGEFSPEYCANCHNTTVWPCSQYIQAMAVLSETDKKKAKLAPQMIVEFTAFDRGD